MAFLKKYQEERQNSLAAVHSLGGEAQSSQAKTITEKKIESRGHTSSETAGNLTKELIHTGGDHREAEDNSKHRS